MKTKSKNRSKKDVREKERGGEKGLLQGKGDLSLSP